ncbi:MAG: DNA repair protein RecN [Gammaproteobacteria bacterium]|nr:DNA repair protein RecN [Gammaproteobacteria bacterium]MBU1655331.1 DNA repair protein RecN [Gammaproteobacteria bacterium]MBU1960990.1 DNA repair protein RecN [Gammaproteobacteria bacterium]
MLTAIHITNLVIVTELELDFRAGMTALTGETGAGKSILIDALGLALGDKGDPAMIRAGEERAEISATFDLGDCPEALAWMERNDMAVVDNECILRRVLTRDKRTRAYINGITVPIPLVQELGELLLDIHGQHAHQSLLKLSHQRDLLDDFAGLGSERREIQEVHRQWRLAEDEFERLRQASEERSARIDLLRFQVGELEQLNLKPGELAALDEEYGRLSHAGRLQEGCGRLLQGFSESDYPLRGQLSQALLEIQELTRLDKGLEDVSQAIDGALIQIDDATSGLRRYLDDLELDPARLQALEQRLADIHDIARKHRLHPEELPDHFVALKQELEGLEHADETLDGLLQRSGALKQGYLELAAKLRETRYGAAGRLSQEVTASMQEMNMTGGRFQVGFEKLELDQATPVGLDKVGFLVSANPGQPLQPLAKTASGGELSRISLAIQVATADCTRVPTLIFDEVDVGIGGGVAEIVGRLLRELGKNRQVMCVTHLAQVAAQAHHHCQVRKKIDGGTTVTEILPLNSVQRIDEVARMLGGVDITQQTRAHAKEMIARAQGPA